MALFQNYHSLIAGTDGQNIVLAYRGDNANSIKSISICNTHSDDITISLQLLDSSNVGFYILRKVVIPNGATLLLNDSNMLGFDNSLNGYSLNLIFDGSSDRADVIIKR